MSVGEAARPARPRRFLFDLSAIAPAAAGRHWFSRDHTTILHARGRMRRRIAADRKFAKQVESLRRIIKKAG